MLKKLIFLMFISTSVFSQVIPPAEPIEPDEEEKEKPVLFEKPKPAWKKRLHYGGNFSFNYFRVANFEISPLLGYDISDKNTILGIGATIIYQGGLLRYDTLGQIQVIPNSRSLSYGGRIFLRQAIFKFVFLHAEYEIMNSDKNNFYNPKSGEETKQWGGSPLVGAGFYQNRQGQKGSYLSLMYNLGAPNYGFISPFNFLSRDIPVVLRLGYFF